MEVQKSRSFVSGRRSHQPAVIASTLLVTSSDIHSTVFTIYFPPARRLVAKGSRGTSYLEAIAYLQYSDKFRS
jgi:hypothetical protein